MSNGGGGGGGEDTVSPIGGFDIVVAYLYDPADAVSVITGTCAGRFGIGSRGKLPWAPASLSDDMREFSRRTANSCVIMGRDTYLSIPERARPLKGRCNIVVCSRESIPLLGQMQHCERDSDDEGTRVTHASSFSDALRIAAAIGSSLSSSSEGDRWRGGTYVVGGEGIYEEAMAHPGLCFVHVTMVRRGALCTEDEWRDMCSRCDRFFLQGARLGQRCGHGVMCLSRRNAPGATPLAEFRRVYHTDMYFRQSRFVDYCGECAAVFMRVSDDEWYCLNPDERHGHSQDSAGFVRCNGHGRKPERVEAKLECCFGTYDMRRANNK